MPSLSSTRIARPEPSPKSTSSTLCLPSVLFTGFSVFPGAPLNPTQSLMPLLSASYLNGDYTDLCSTFTTKIFPVEYSSLADRLSELAVSKSISGSPPHDIVVHFGLDGGATGITLERFARNRCGDHPDNIGHCFSGSIVSVSDEEDSEDIIPSRLPLLDIHDELERRGIPVQWSDDAGGYLCNYIFYLSASTSRQKPCPEWTPGMVGFVHVPRMEETTWTGEKKGMELGIMQNAAEAILEICSRSWMAQMQGK